VTSLFGRTELTDAEVRQWARLAEDFPVAPGTSYRDYLKTPRWYLVRELILARYGDHCQNCGSTESVNVHHRTYTHLFEEAHHLEDLVVLCQHCHGKHHRGEIDIERILRSITA
jgi:5-methylcytosine-specific restriction endonuclease McrA